MDFPRVLEFSQFSRFQELQFATYSQHIEFNIFSKTLFQVAEALINPLNNDPDDLVMKKIINANIQVIYYTLNYVINEALSTDWISALHCVQKAHLTANMYLRLSTCLRNILHISLHLQFSHDIINSVFDISPPLGKGLILENDESGTPIPSQQKGSNSRW